MKNGDFAWRYLQRARELLADDGMLGPHQVVEVWDSLYHTISSALYAESARWGDYRRDVHPYTTRGKLYTVEEHYMKERNRLLNNYFPIRSRRVLNDIERFVGDIPSGMAAIAFPTTDTPYYNLNGQPVRKPTKGIYIKDGRKVVIH